MNPLRNLWRLIRPAVYSLGDYAALVNSRPEELTMRELRALDALAGRGRDE